MRSAEAYSAKELIDSVKDRSSAIAQAGILVRLAKAHGHMIPRYLAEFEALQSAFGFSLHEVGVSEADLQALRKNSGQFVLDDGVVKRITEAKVRL